MKRVVLILLFYCMTIGSSALLYAYQNEPDGFRGLKWQDEAEKYKDLQLSTTSGDVRLYIRKNENLNIGNIPIRKVEYLFYKNRFYKAVVYYKDTDSTSLERNLSAVYGQGKSEYIVTEREADRAGKASQSAYWYGKKVDIKLIRQTRMELYNPDEPDCDGNTIGSSQTIGPVTFFTCLSYTFKPIDIEKKKDEKEKFKKETSQRKKEEKKKGQSLHRQIEKDL